MFHNTFVSMCDEILRYLIYGLYTSFWPDPSIDEIRGGLFTEPA